MVIFCFLALITLPYAYHMLKIAVVVLLTTMEDFISQKKRKECTKYPKKVSAKANHVSKRTWDDIAQVRMI